MAQRSQSHPENIPGPFFVDRSCIDCGTCYQFLPEVFSAAGEHSCVHRQPANPEQRHRALMAMLACPTGSIGSDERRGTREALAAFPDPIEGEVAFCGFTSERSFGAWSYFIQRPEGNVLVDSPRAVPTLMERLAGLGGVELLVLSHKDDVADHAQFQARFQCRRVMHRADLGPDTAGVEWPIYAREPLELAPDLLLIPTPGHTQGSVCLLYRKTFLFTGDHLWWNPRLERLSASRTYCWHDWPTQLKSLERLLDYPFTWVLPGHGHAHHTADAATMRQDLERAIDQLKRL